MLGDDSFTFVNVDKTFTFREIANSFKVSLGFLQNLIDRHPEEFEWSKSYTKTGKEKRRFTYQDYLTVKDYVQAFNVKKAERKKRLEELCNSEQEKKSLEELRKEHPLVKDDRFFNVNYWPETTPKLAVFEED